MGAAGERAAGPRLHRAWLGRTLVQQSIETRLAGLSTDRERPAPGGAELSSTATSARGGTGTPAFWLDAPVEGNIERSSSLWEGIDGRGNLQHLVAQVSQGRWRH